MNDLDRATLTLTAARKVMFLYRRRHLCCSGIPTFRDKLTGLREKHDPERLETAQAFRENPQLVFGGYLRGRHQVDLAEPNAAHLSIYRLASTSRQVSVITQNIDDLHERAGSRSVVPLHGSTPHLLYMQAPSGADD